MLNVAKLVTMNLETTCNMIFSVVCYKLHPQRCMRAQIGLRSVQNEKKNVYKFPVPYIHRLYPKNHRLMHWLL